MVNLRELRLEDAPYMYEFIEDKDISANFLYTRYPNSIEGLEKFILNSIGDRNNVHFAIESEKQEFVGTISLKNINYIDRNAEYAISIRKKFWGQNYATVATERIIGYAINTLNMYKIYFNVLSTNKRAIGFYEKFGFEQEAVFKNHVYINGKYEDLIWFRYLQK